MAETLDFSDTPDSEIDIYTEEIYEYLHESNFEEGYLDDDFELDQLSLQIKNQSKVLFEIGTLDDHVHFVDFERNSSSYHPLRGYELTDLLEFLVDSADSLN